MKKTLLHEKGLSLERLMSLYAVYTHGGVAKAAPGDVVTQNLIGRQLRELEMFFHATLTTKHGKVLTLTKEGRELATIAGTILKAIEDFKHRMNGQRRLFTIGAGGTLYTELAAPRVMSLAGYDFELHLEELYGAEIFEQLQSSALDIAISWETPPPQSHFERRLLGNFSYVLIGSKSLLNRAKHHDEYLSRPFVVVERRDTTDEIRSRLRSEEVIFVNEYVAALRLVETGKYLAILPRLFLKRLPTRSFVSKELDWLTTFKRSVYLYWNGNSALRRGFSRVMMEEIARGFNFSTVGV